MADPKDPHHSFEDLAYGVGQNADGTINSFPLAELDARVEARRSEEEAIAFAVEQSRDGFPEEQEEDFADLAGA